MFGKNSDTYIQWQYNWDRFNNMPRELDVINLGSTMAAYDFNYELWKKSGVKGFNLASSPQTLYYDLQVLEQFGGHLKKGATVIICLAEYSFLVEKYDSDYHNYKYYGYLDHERILNYSSKKENLIKNIPSKLDSRLSQQEKKKALKNVLGLKTTKKVCDIYIHARQVMTGWKHEFGWDNGYSITREQEESISRTWEILQKIFSYCTEHGFKAVVVVPPFAKYLKEIMPEKILEECLWKYRSIIKDKGIKVIDFWNDDNLQKHELYDNSLCLNETGRDIFNELIQHELFGTEIDSNIKAIYKKGNDDSIDQVRHQTLNNTGKARVGKISKHYVLRNGVEIPWISYGTGVVWKYTRNPGLFLKVNAKQVAFSIYRRKWNRELQGNIHIKEVLNSAYDVGFRMFDTGRIYAKSEKSIGDTISNKKDVFVTSKCSAMDVERDCSPNSVRGNLEISLRNLKRDKLDLYLLHWPEGEHWLEYYAQIIDAYKAGKVRAFGACNLKMEHIKAIQDAGLELPMVIQEECHPFYTREDVRAFCRENCIQFEAHTATMRSNPIALENDVLLSIAKKYNKTVPQIIIRWHYQNDVIPVCSSFSKHHMKENMEVFDFDMTEDEMKAIDGLNMDYVCLDATGIDDPNYIFNK